MSDKHAGGRPPLGTGGHLVSIRESNKGSHRITIGKELWRAIGSPDRVAIERRGNALHIAPTDSEGSGTHAISGASGSIPSISIGTRICRDELRIMPPDTWKQCHVRRGEIIVLVGG